MISPSAAEEKWWQEAVIYQIYPRSFFDSNGDGEGDLPGITQKLQYVADLGVDAIWLSPFYTSPNKDGGYDVADPRDVDPRFGNLADAKLMIDKAHELGLKVLVDIVPNHFSSEHEWFKAALNAGPGSKERARFHFHDAKEDGTPPNNWISLFGGPAWTQVADGQFYLHLFDSSQPDLNWENPEVDQDFRETISFWVKMGADGFRIDVAHGLVKENLLNDHHDPKGLSDALRIDVDMETSKREALLASVPYFDRVGVHEIYRNWRKHFDSFNKPIMAVAEAWVHPPINGVAYVRADELHQIFNFDLLIAPFEAQTLFKLIDNTISMLKEVDAYPTWAISNHDSPRVASRIGTEEARALALFLFALPGSCYVYNGQELGLPDAELADSDRQDPSFFRTNGETKGRDGARVPMPWTGTTSPFGFSSGKPWLPLPATWSELTVENQSSNSDSSLSLYKRALSERAKLLAGAQDLTWDTNRIERGVLGFSRGGIQVYLNTGDKPVRLKATELILASGGVPECENGELELKSRRAVWFKLKDF
jgi:alpha-glucosidase